MTRKDIINLQLMINNEKDFNREFERLLKFKGLKIISDIRPSQ